MGELLYFPKQTPDKPKFVRLTVNITPEDVHAIEEGAKRTGLNRTDYIRRAIQVCYVVDNMSRQRKRELF